MMADFLTRLIERSRGLATQGQPGQRVEPVIASFYAAGPNTALPDGTMDEELASTVETESQHQAPAPSISETAPQGPKENISIAPSPQHHELSKIRPARALADETQQAQRDQTSGIEPLTPTTKSTFPLAQLVNTRPGLTDPARQFHRANQEPLMIRPRVAHADESGSATTNGAANEAANQIANISIGDQAEPVIRVTIGRIDVRAVTQASPPARRATPTEPKLSLEDYLRSRSGGKR